MSCDIKLKSPIYRVIQDDNYCNRQSRQRAYDITDCL